LLKQLAFFLTPPVKIIPTNTDDMNMLRPHINEKNTGIKLVSRSGAYKTPAHRQPEFELILVKEGVTKRLIGDKMETFTAGEVIFLGSGAGYSLLNENNYSQGIQVSGTATSILLHFNKDIFSQGFYQLEETVKINEFFARASRGIKIKGKTMQVIAHRMQVLLDATGFDRVIGMMEILHILSLSKEVEYITGEARGAKMPIRCDRLNDVYTYVADNYYKDITLQSIASVAHLTPPAFCRVFKQQTKKHFIEYLNEVRISNACKYLAQSSLNISEIGFECGYKTISNFNKIFKKITGFSPKEYRLKVFSEQHRVA